jgi:hypothetical protein
MEGNALFGKQLQTKVPGGESQKVVSKIMKFVQILLRLTIFSRNKRLPIICLEYAYIHVNGYA